MKLRSILQHYTDTMHMQSIVRESERPSIIFSIKEPVELLVHLRSLLINGKLNIAIERNDYSYTSIIGETLENEVSGYGDRSEKIEDNTKECLHNFFNSLDVSDIRFLMDKNGEKI